MPKKMISCKVCGADIAKSAKVCPACGAKNKKKTALGIALLIIGICLIAAAAGTSSIPKQSNQNTFGIGETAVSNDITAALIDVKEINGDPYFPPSEGNVYVICEFEIENNTEHEITVSSMMSFEAYFDDYSANVDYMATTLGTSSTGKAQLDGTVAGGKKMNGVIGFQAAEDWETLEIRFTPEFWTITDIVFEYTK